MSNRSLVRSVEKNRAQQRIKNMHIMNELKNIINSEIWYLRVFIAARIIVGRF